MYKNIGKKIKILATVIFIMGAIVSLVEGIYLISHDMVLGGFIAILFGPVLSWASSFLVYGFGEIIDTLHKIEGKTQTNIKRKIPVAKKHKTDDPFKDDGETYKPIDLNKYDLFQ